MFPIEIWYFASFDVRSVDECTWIFLRSRKTLKERPRLTCLFSSLCPEKKIITLICNMLMNCCAMRWKFQWSPKSCKTSWKFMYLSFNNPRCFNDFINKEKYEIRWLLLIFCEMLRQYSETRYETMFKDKRNNTTGGENAVEFCIRANLVDVKLHDKRDDVVSLRIENRELIWNRIWRK